MLLEKLATGGMAEVFLARGTGTGGIGKFFAIKRILPQYSDSPEFREMFETEAKIAINLNHSNIVSIHGFENKESQLYIVMDYVEGRNLRQILNKMKKTGQQYSPEQIVYIMREVAAGLEHAHRSIDESTGKPKNIIHRDISPQNVMVSFEGEVKIVDFGIAKAESQIETTRAGTLKGKFGYMSPEQAEGQPLDLRTDIFSLGIVFWELLANERLFVANNEINTIRKIRDCQIPSLRKTNPNIHSELERIVQKALARDRNLRYQTAAAMNRDLNRFLNRQYPDFSTQEFAVFVRSFFTDEILSLRKRLVEYTKINLNSELSASSAIDSDPTRILDTNTDSLVVTDGSLSVNNSDVMSGLNSTNTDSSQPGSEDLTTGNKSDIGSKGGFTLNLDDAIPSELAPKKGSPEKRVSNQNSSASDTKTDTFIETHEISNINNKLLNNLPPGVRSQHQSQLNSGYSNSSSSATRITTLILFSALCLGVYSSLVKYFPVMMEPVIAVTDPVLRPLHDNLIEKRNVAAAPQRPSPPQGSTVATELTTQPPLPTKSPPAQVASAGLMVTSIPSGAEVFLNNRAVGLQTPTRIEVPVNQNFSISIRKRGYKDYSRNNVSIKELGSRVDTTLIKINLAYIDVDIIPPQEVLLYVNGRSVPMVGGKARDIAIPSNTVVRIRAESRTANTYDEISVKLSSDKRRMIRLNPRKLAKPTTEPVNE